MPALTFSQQSTAMLPKATMVSKGRDTLYLLNTDLGKQILTLWLSDTSYQPVSIILKSRHIVGSWKTNKRDKSKPLYIVMVDAISFSSEGNY